ncbi:MAG: hypothetical protein K1X67_02605 [Fimbriimonadaceae bacterium]|nr:hypothetical protein [Fimbriimonadaceae bacterium]
MRSSLDELTRELEELGLLVASIDPVNQALAGHQDSVVRQYVLVRRRFDYAAFAVALYASFEKFLEELVAAFAQLESRRLPYAELPAKLATRHLSGTAEMLSRGRIGEGRYRGTTQLEVVRNLFECLNGASPYKLNEAAVVAHDTNLRVTEINTLFATVGIEQVCERIRRADSLLEWYRKVKELEAVPEEGVPPSVIDERIKDLVERRNLIAHRGGTPVDLLGVKEMDEAIGFILAFSRSVFAIAVGRYLRDHHAKTGIQLAQRQGDGPYRNGTVVVVEPPTHRLFLGQPVFVLSDATGARWGRIQSLQLDDAAVDAIELGAAAVSGIGIGLNFKCPKGALLGALATDDDVVWNPQPETVVAPVPDLADAG